LFMPFFELLVASCKKYKIYIAFLILTFIFVFPLFYVHYPSLMDDGIDITLTKQAKSYLDLFINELVGGSRTRPLRLIYRKVLFDLFDIDLAYHFLVQSSVLWLIVSLVFKLIKEITRKKNLAILGGLLVFLLPATVGNFYRLGTTEHLQVLVLLLTLIAIRYNWWLAFCLALINCFIKETSLFFFLIPLINAVVYQKNKHWMIATNLFTLTMIAGFYYYKMVIADDLYVNQAKLNIANITQLIPYSGPNLIILVLATIYFALNFVKKKTIPKTEFMILISAFCSLLPAFIWDMQLAYYQYPLQIFTLILFFTWINKQNKIKKSKKKHFLTVIISIALFLTCKVWFFNSKDILIEHYERHLAEAALVSFILNNNWTNYHVYLGHVGSNNFETNLEISGYFTEWHTYPPLAFYPNMEKWANISFLDEKSLNKLTDESIATFIKDDYPKKILLQKTEDDHQGNICGFSPFVGRICQYQTIE